MFGKRALKTAQFSGCHLQHKDLVFLNYKSATHRAALFSTLFVISNFPHGQLVKEPGKRSTFGCVYLMKQSIGKDVTNVLDHSCHKGQLGPFAQCDLVHTGQNRTMQYFCTQA